jgi:hypothetical protein
MVYQNLIGEVMWRWVHTEKRRYYQVDLVPDLFGDWFLVWAWGSLDSGRGGQRSTCVASYAEGIRRIDAIGQRRQRRGYATDGSGGSQL